MTSEELTQLLNVNSFKLLPKGEVKRVWIKPVLTGYFSVRVHLLIEKKQVMTTQTVKLPQEEIPRILQTLLVRNVLVVSR